MTDMIANEIWRAQTILQVAVEVAQWVPLTQAVGLFLTGATLGWLVRGLHDGMWNSRVRAKL